MSVAGEAARRHAMAAYRTALDHPRTSIGGIIIAALVGGLLWYMFGDEPPGAAPPSHRLARARGDGASAQAPLGCASGIVMIRLLVTAATVSGLLRYVFGQESWAELKAAAGRCLALGASANPPGAQAARPRAKYLILR